MVPLSLQLMLRNWEYVKCREINQIFLCWLLFFFREIFLNVFKNILSLNKKLESEEHQKKDLQKSCSDNTGKVSNNIVFVSETFAGGISWKPTRAG